MSNIRKTVDLDWRRWLSELGEGYAVEVWHNGRQAWEIARETYYTEARYATRAGADKCAKRLSDSYGCRCRVRDTREEQA